MAKTIAPSDITIAWICALPVELAAASVMLDEEYANLPQPPNDTNIYIYGRVGNHDVIVAGPPAGMMGIYSAAVVASQMKNSFPALRFGVLVGIGGGIPTVDNDVRLGDVVISQPTGQHGGVVQVDFGSTGLDGHITRTGSLSVPPMMLSSALAKLRTNGIRAKIRISEHLSIFSRVRGFSYPGVQQDKLYTASSKHVGSSCGGCNPDDVVEREERETDKPALFFGTIASGNRVLKDGLTRDRISREPGGVLCFEMEAAGLMDDFPCLVIRGICDYADAHKNDQWQRYAAATAAACTKELLCTIPPIRSTVSIQQESYGKLLQEFQSSSWFERLSRFKEMTLVKDPEKHVKIAILDTGVRYDEDAVPNSTLVDYKSFVGESSWKKTPGKNSATKLISIIAPRADLYVGRVPSIEEVGLERHLESPIAQAIRYSVSSWEVDVISFSFNILDRSQEVQEAIEYALMSGVTIIAPAGSYDSTDEEDSLLTSSSGVLSIYGSTNQGLIPNSSRPLLPKTPTFPAVGETANLLWLPAVQKVAGQTFASGTSIATSIATGIAALVLDYVRQMSEEGLLNVDEVAYLRRSAGFKSVFKAMELQEDGMRFLAPWILFNPEKPAGEIAEAVRRTLPETTETRQGFELDFADTVPVAEPSDITGTTLHENGLTSMEESLALLLLEDPVLKPLYPACLTRAGFSSFQENFGQLLQLYASRLLKEAQTELQRRTVLLLWKRAVAVTNKITNLISLSDEDKVAAMSDLRAQEPARAEILSRYINPTQQVIKEIVSLATEESETDIDLPEDEDVEDADQQAFDKVELVKEFMISSQPFRSLQEEMYIFAYPETKERICHTLQNSGLFLTDSHIESITCKVRWEVLACLESEIDNFQKLEEVITFTGSSTHAQATSCSTYMLQTWPNTGNLMMQAFKRAVITKSCEERFATYHVLKMKLTSAIQSPEQPELAEITLSGSLSEVTETLDQLSWLAATFRKPQGDHMIRSFTILSLVSRSPTMESPAAFDLVLLAPRPIIYRPGMSGGCWIRLLRKSVLACGFPIPTREECFGLEIPFPLMAYLTGARYPVGRGKGLVFRSRQRYQSRVSYILVPTRELKNATQWHLIEVNADPLLTSPEDAYFLKEMETNPDLWYQTVDLERLVKSRTFLGYWKVAKVQIGTRKYDRCIRPFHRVAGHEEDISIEANTDESKKLASDMESYLSEPTEEFIVRNAQRTTIPNRIVADVMERAASQPLLLYDTKTYNAWMVSELSVALQMTHHYLRTKTTIRPRLRLQLHYANAADDGGNAAKYAIERSGDRKLWRDKDFEHFVKMFLDVIECVEPLWLGATEIRAWNFIDVQNLKHTFSSELLTDEHNSTRFWWNIARNREMRVLIGENFGQVIEPDKSRFRVCSNWSKIPDEKGLLTASMPCSFHELDQHAEVNGLLWYRPEGSTPFEEICGGHNLCLPIQGLREKSTTDSQSTQSLPEEGAVIFGEFCLDKLDERCHQLKKDRDKRDNRNGTSQWLIISIMLALGAIIMAS